VGWHKFSYWNLHEAKFLRSYKPLVASLASNDAGKEEEFRDTIIPEKTFIKQIT
jgi:hypothetical protein